MGALFGFLAPYRLLIEGAVLLALIAGLYAFGYRHGEAHVQAKWDAAEVVRKAAEQAREESNRLAAQSAATRYEAASAAINARHPHATETRRAALLQPAAFAAASSEPSASEPAPALGAVRIGADILDSLRESSGASGIPPEPAAAGPGAALRGGAGLPEPAAGGVDLSR